MLNFLNFAAAYGLTKCVKTMLAGTVLMAVIRGVKKLNRGRVPLADYYALLFLPLALFCGMSRLFYMPYTVRVSTWLNTVCTAWLGGLYFCVAFAFFAVGAGRALRLRRLVRRLPLYGDGALVERVKARVCAEDLTGLGRWYVKRVRVYETAERVSPFSGGLLKPYVVLPEHISRRWSARELEVVLCHELLHIRMGHIFWMAVYRLLVCLWWVHPLVYAYDGQLRQLMEQVCDERVLALSGVSRDAYGQLLLDLAGMIQKRAPQGSAAFFGGSDFQVLFRRIGALAGAGLSGARRRRMAGCVLALFMAAAVFLAATSYPRYTRMTQIALFDESLTLCAYDTAELREAVCVQGGQLVVEPERFAALVDALGISGEYVYLSFGGIMKVPGAGGCGDVGMVSLSDYTDIIYLSGDSWENDALEFLLKYAI